MVNRKKSIKPMVNRKKSIDHMVNRIGSTEYREQLKENNVQISRSTEYIDDDLS